MSRIVRVGMLIGGLALGATSNAYADGYLEVLNRCGGVFQTCGSVTVRVTGTQVRIRVQNLSGSLGGNRGGVFTAITLSNLPTNIGAGLGSSVTGPSYLGATAPAVSSWRTTSAPAGSIRVIAAPGDNAVDNGIASACITTPTNLVSGSKTNLWMTPGCGATNIRNSATNTGWVEIAFTTNMTWDPTNVKIALTHVNISNMTQVETWNTCVGAECTAGVTPEPATVLLLGSGLGALALRARRRNRSTTV